MNLAQIIDELKSYDGKDIKIMEVCGTHTASIFKNGIRNLISPKIHLISGPGCPVCVTTAAYIDKLVALSLLENHCILSFGDMMKVKGSNLSLSDAKARGGKVKILYSPIAALKEASDNPQIQYIFAAVGFETTTPIYGILIEEIKKNHILNLKILTSLKTILPALSFICEKEAGIDAFLCPGHVSVITGAKVYKELAENYRKPFVIAGFEGEHILAAVDEIMHQLEKKQFHMKNMYVSAVSEEGNQKAIDVVNQYFEVTDDVWRGIGLIKNSALKIKEEYKEYNAECTLKEYETESTLKEYGTESTNTEINLEIQGEQMPQGCRCTDVILGRISPAECSLFNIICTPLNALGPCMVSAEGACGIWYKHREHV